MKGRKNMAQQEPKATILSSRSESPSTKGEEFSVIAVKPEDSSGKSGNEAGGPRTKIGKQTSSRNSIKHGIFADILLSGNKMGKASEEYLRLLSALRSAMRPADSFEDIQVEKLAFLQLRLTRVYEADWRVAPKLFKKLADGLDADSPLQGTGIINDGLEVLANREDPAPELLFRYESNLERQIGRTIDQLRQWRTVRPNSAELLAKRPDARESQ
jgi:hypothetical protein